jgi:hypothetical protein
MGRNDSKALSRMGPKGKRGQAEYLLENVFRIGFLMIALLAFFLLVNFYINNKIETSKLESEVLANRIIYSDAIMYKDSATQRIYTGIIDTEKFKDSNALDKNIDYSIKRHATAMLELTDNVDGKVRYTNYLNKDQYLNLKVLADAKTTGKGSVTRYVKYYPATYKDDSGSYRYGTIKMSIIIPNS